MSNTKISKLQNPVLSKFSNPFLRGKLPLLNESSRFEPKLRSKREYLGGGFPEIMEVLDPARLSLDSVVDLGVGVIEAQ